MDLCQSMVLHNSYFHAMRAQNYICIFSHLFIRISIQNRLKILLHGGKRACMISELLSAAVRITARKTPLGHRRHQEYAELLDILPWRRCAFVSLCAARPAMAPAGKSECRMVFDHIDEDESEALSLTEVSAALEKVGSDMGQAEVEELLETMDTDGSKYVEFDEFEEWWRYHEEDRGALFGRLLRRCKADAGAGALQGTDGAKTAPVLPYTKAAGKSDCRKVFERMDADGGGTLDIDEIRAMLVLEYSSCPDIVSCPAHMRHFKNHRPAVEYRLQ